MNLTITPQFTYKNTQAQESTNLNPVKINATSGGGGDLTGNHLKVSGVKVFTFPTFSGKQVHNTVGENLAPLARDTVSFKGLRGDKIMSEVTGDVTTRLALSLEQEAKVPMEYMQTVLKKYLRNFVSTDTNSDRVVQKLSFRIKDKDSIWEKLNAIGAKKNINLSAYANALKQMGDIVGARIVLRDDSKAAVKDVLGTLGRAVQDGKLIVTEIENYCPVVTSVPDDIVRRYRKDLGIKLTDAEKKEMTRYDFFSYADYRDLQEFGRICRTKVRDLEIPSGKDIPNGYQAIHLAVKLPNGYTGEIQILGRDVEMLKEVEDFYYKAKAGKGIKYPEVRDRLAPLGDPDDLFLQDAVEEYTRWAYIGQRLKGAESHRKKTSEKFLVADMYLLDKGLGFNQLNTLIKNAKIAYKEAQDVAGKKKSS